MAQWVSLMLPGYLLVLCRITSFFVAAPVLSMRGVPMPFKVGLSLFLAFLTFFSVGTVQTAAWNEAYLLSVLKEILVGLLLGFTANLFFSALFTSGAFVDMMIGFGIANVVDPATGMQSPLFGNFKYFLAVLVFLAMNGHHHLINAIMMSYEWVPMDPAVLASVAAGDVSAFLLKSFAYAFALAFQMAAPIVVAMFLVDVGLGILAKTAPQFNVFVVGIPVKMIVGLLLIILVIPGFAMMFERLFAAMFASVNELLGILGRRGESG